MIIISFHIQRSVHNFDCMVNTLLQFLHLSVLDFSVVFFFFFSDFSCVVSLQPIIMTFIKVPRLCSAEALIGDTEHINVICFTK